MGSGCSSSNNALDSSTELHNCIGTLEPTFKVERTVIYDQLRSAITRGQVNPQDPTVKADLATITGEINSSDQIIQGVTCSNGGFQYLRNVQGVSTSLKGATFAASQWIANQDPAQKVQAARQISQATSLMKQASDIRAQAK